MVFIIFNLFCFVRNGFLRFPYLKSREDAIKNLNHIYDLENNYFKINNKYSAKFDEIKFIPKANNGGGRYVYFLGEDKRYANSNFSESYHIKELPKYYSKMAYANQKSFQALAVSDLDPTNNKLDILSVNEKGKIEIISNDFIGAYIFTWDNCTLYLMKEKEIKYCIR